MLEERDFNAEGRKWVIGGIAVVIVLVYIVRLFFLQLLSEDFRVKADSNAFYHRVQYPARGAIRDRKGHLLVYNQPAYDTATRHVKIWPDGRRELMPRSYTLSRRAY